MEARWNSNGPEDFAVGGTVDWVRIIGVPGQSSEPGWAERAVDTVWTGMGPGSRPRPRGRLHIGRCNRYSSPVTTRGYPSACPHEERITFRRGDWHRPTGQESTT